MDMASHLLWSVADFGFKGGSLGEWKGLCSMQSGSQKPIFRRMGVNYFMND